MRSRTRAKDGWTRVRFGDVVRLVRDRVDPDTSGIERYVAGEHMDTDDLRIRRWGEVGNGYLGPAFHMRFRPGHVLYGSRRTYLRKVALADFEGICANTTFVLESADPLVLLPELLPYVMQTEAFHDHSIKQSKGSVNPYVNFSDLAWHELDLPPIEEQRSRLRVLHQASMHAENLRALTAASRCLLSALSKDFEERHRETMPLAHMVTKLEPGSSPPSNGLAVPAGPAVLKVSAVGDWVFRQDENKSISCEYFDATAEVRVGDILFTRANADVTGVGRSCVVVSCRPDLMLSDKTWRVHLAPQFEGCGHALVAVSKGSRFRAHVEQVLAGTDAKNISQQRLLSAPVPKATPGEWEALNRNAATALAAYHAATTRSSNRVMSLVNGYLL